MKQRKGISLIVLVITIIIMIIISGAIILTLTETSVIDKSEDATYAYNNKQYFELIRNEYLMLRLSDEAKGKTSLEVFEILKDKINRNAEDVEYITGTKAMNITIDNTYKYTAFYDGEVKYGEYAYLDIADGSIQLKQTGYIQGTNPLVEYDGDYIITGTTTTNNVRVMEEGTYNVTIRDLSISNTGGAFIANAGKKQTGTFVNLYIEGENSLFGDVGLHFTHATPNINGKSNGSTLTIQGEGSLYAKGGTYSAAIGSGYGKLSGDVANIIINNGNIIAEKGKSFGAAIGSGRYDNASNIIINGGSITVSGNYGTGIGGHGDKGAVDNLMINGGIIRAIGGKNGPAIGGEVGSGKIKITGGIIYLNNSNEIHSLLGNNCSSIEITGGTIICNSTKAVGIGTKDITQNINVTGGSIYMDRKDNLYAVPPTTGTNNVYLTEIQLQNVTEEVQVTSFITSDNLSYGIKDMYTTAEGKLYLYLPTGERTITIKAGEKEYTGTVVTGEADATESVTLAEK